VKGLGADSLSGGEQVRVTELDEKLARRGCLNLGTVETNLGKQLFEKLRAAGTAVVPGQMFIPF
jgi:hypothetical protein